MYSKNEQTHLILFVSLWRRNPDIEVGSQRRLEATGRISADLFVRRSVETWWTPEGGYCDRRAQLRLRGEAANEGASKPGATPSVSIWISAPYDKAGPGRPVGLYAPLRRRG